MLEHHHGRVSRALLDLFPHIGLEKTKLWTRGIPLNQVSNIQNLNLSIDLTDWRDAKNRRKLFEDFAKRNQFDPLVAEHWYATTHEQVAAFKVYISLPSPLSPLPSVIPPFLLLDLSLFTNADVRECRVLYAFTRTRMCKPSSTSFLRSDCTSLSSLIGVCLLSRSLSLPLPFSPFSLPLLKSYYRFGGCQ